MPDAYWQDKGGWRTQPRPTGWKQIRERIIARDGGVCQWPTDDHGTICGQPGNQVDHRIPAFRGGTDDDTNLWLLCVPHHRHKTSSDAGKEAWRNRPRRWRPPERHPGLIEPDDE